MACTDIYDSCLSNKSKVLSSVDDFSWALKCFKYCAEVSYLTIVRVWAPQTEYAVGALPSSDHSCFTFCSGLRRSRVSSGSIVSWLRTGRPGDRGSIPCGGRGFFLQLPDRLWGPHSLLSNGYRGPFRGGKARPGRDADHSPHLVPRSRMSRSCTSSPPKRLHDV
jgi:hypothetical protein